MDGMGFYKKKFIKCHTSPLHIASEIGDLETVKLLEECGANNNFKVSQYFIKKNKIVLSYPKDCCNTTFIIVANFEDNHLFSKQISPIAVAILYNKNDIVDYFIDHKQINVQEDIAYLYLAIRANNLHALKKLSQCINKELLYNNDYSINLLYYSIIIKKGEVDMKQKYKLVKYVYNNLCTNVNDTLNIGT
jgi:hypothetical protein